jgi:hypothetical protein
MLILARFAAELFFKAVNLGRGKPAIFYLASSKMIRTDKYFLF